MTFSKLGAGRQPRRSGVAAISFERWRTATKRALSNYQIAVLSYLAEHGPPCGRTRRAGGSLGAHRDGIVEFNPRPEKGNPTAGLPVGVGNAAGESITPSRSRLY